MKYIRTVSASLRRPTPFIRPNLASIYRPCFSRFQSRTHESDAIADIIRSMHSNGEAPTGGNQQTQTQSPASSNFPPAFNPSNIIPSSTSDSSNPYNSWSNNEASIPANRSNDYLQDLPPLSRATVEQRPRLGPTAGKSVTVRSGNLASAIFQLRSITAENSIAKDASIQRFHERPGIKKKRLRRERFRRRFKAGFKRMVQTVVEMKRQGI